MIKDKIKSPTLITNAIIIFLIAGLVILAYWGIHDHQFLNFDDDMYVLGNEYVKNGLSWENIKWAFGFAEDGYWHPLAYLSLMLDCQFFGLRPGPLLLENLIFHIFNAIFLFLILFKMSGARFKSALVAVLFALHPLNVESVAWLAERKTVLSVLFFLASIYAYIVYTSEKKIWIYGLILFFYILGLMAKPIILIFPFIILFLDYWPLKRFRMPEYNDAVIYKLLTPIKKFISFCKLNIRIIVYEKLPFVLISIVSLIISMLSLLGNKEVINYESVTLHLRVANFFVSIIKYLRNIAWPVELSIFYPFPEKIITWHFLIAMFFIIALTVFVIFMRKQRPWLFVGWCWFVIALMPASGILQSGLWPSMANRFMYLPLMGFFIMIVWEADERLKGRYSDFLKIILCVMAISYFAFITRIQNIYYSNSYSLFKRSLEVVEDNALALNNIAVHLTSLGRNDEAIEYLDRALELYPQKAGFYHNYGVSLAEKGEQEKAALYFKKAISLDPKLYGSYVNLGLITSHQGDNKEALKLLSKAMEIKPENFNVRNNYGAILLKLGKYEEAIPHFLFVVKRDPTNVPARLNLASAYQSAGLYSKAMTQYETLDKTVTNNKGYIYYGMAGLHSEQKKYKKCKKYLEMSLEEGYNIFDNLATDNRFRNFRDSMYYKQFLKEQGKNKNGK